VDIQDDRLVLRALGFLLLLAGIGCAFLGPVEIYVLYLFSEGGRFYYDGFRFGSFMFGNIAIQVLGYYLLAAVLIPLGYGHLFLRRWAQPLARALLGIWLLLGLPLLIVLFFMTAAVKSFSTAGGVVFIALLAASYFVLPWLAIRFYRSQRVRAAFAAGSPQPGALEARPMPILVLCLLDLFFLIALHLPLLFRGLFPLFGTLLGDLQGIYCLSAEVLLLAALLWGTWMRYGWAWWGSLLFYVLLATTWLVTFARTSYADLLAWLQFSPTETGMLSGIPLQGWHIGVFVALPMLATLIVVLASRCHFRSAAPAAHLDIPGHAKQNA